jgi:hypothetical protein
LWQHKTGSDNLGDVNTSERTAQTGQNPWMLFIQGSRKTTLAGGAKPAFKLSIVQKERSMWIIEE